MTNVVVFCGGRGSTTILTSLARTKNILLSVVVNAYDAGLSTGRVRRAFPGVLGPSDLRKTAGTLASAVGDSNARALAALFEARLARDLRGLTPEANAEAAHQLSALIEGQLSALDLPLAGLLRGLSLGSWLRVREALVSFEKSLTDSGAPFAHDDLAIGNAVLAGLFASTGTFQSAVRAYEDLLGLENHRVFNVTQGEDLWLSAVAGDIYCPDEGTLVSGNPPAPITDLFLLPRKEHDLVYEGRTEWTPKRDLAFDPSQFEALPSLDPLVASKIRAADVIVYGPGTQHSSLFPTYLTAQLGEEIAANTEAEKLFVANIGRDLDQHPDETAKDNLIKFRYFMSRRGTADASLESYITTVLIGDEAAQELGDLVEPAQLRQAVWADPTGRHSGPAVKEEIASVVRFRSGEQLPGDSGLASIIVPVLNERPRLEAVLQQLRYLDLGEFDMVQEIIVVDGGSTDGTLDLLRSAPDVTLVESNCKGRGSAIREGLTRARGEYVVSFPADGEYEVGTIPNVLRQLLADPETVVLASRALGGSSASQRLREVYSDNKLLYLLSHWGGVAVTLLLMLRLDRVISDPLSGVRGALRNTFRELDNSGDGLDYDVRWVRRAVASGRRIVEVPTNYKPRGWKDGKKTTVTAGLKALSSTLWAPEENLR